MAAGNKVVLTFSGDSSQLEDSFDKVGRGARGMGDKVDNAADRFDRVGDSADNLDTRAMGMRDTFTGVQDTWQGLTKDGATMQERMLLLGMGIGDLASGVANFGVQFAKQAANFVTNGAKMVASHAANVAKIVAGWVLMGVQATINAAKMAVAWLISLGPVGLVIAAVGAVIAVLVALGVDFDMLAGIAGAAWDLILGAARSVWDWLSQNWPLVLAILTGPIGLAVLAITSHWGTIKAGFTAVKDWIGARIGDIVGFFTGLPGRIASAGSDMFGAIRESFRGALNAIIRWWNDLSLTFPSVKLPGFLGGGTLGGWTLTTEDIPTLHSGGVFHAPSGQREGLAMLLDGETVTRPGQSTGTVVNVYVQGSLLTTRQLVSEVRDELLRGGFGGVR